MRRYYSGITIFKLAGSLLVLLAHVMYFRYVEFMPNQQMQFVLLILRVIVPCFYVVAGFLAYKGWVHAANSRQYVRKYLLRIVWMYGFFCLIFIAEFIVPELISKGLSLPNLFLQAKILFMTVFLNGPFVQLWFIPPLIFSILVCYWFYEKKYVRLAVILGLLGFVVSQFVSGTLMTALAPAVGSTPITNPTYLHYLDLFVTRYFGYGFTFVLAGVILAKYEDKFVQSKIWPLLIPSVVLTLVETLLLLRFAQWSLEYKLAFSILPNTILLFYGVLHIKSQAIQSYHKVINLFSIVTFCGHVLFMKLNLLLLNWDTATMTISQDFVFLFLTFFECLAVTYLFTFRAKYFAAKQARNLSS
ncbi:acyltransferase family protein [Paenibacillus eucommiae]|uniref:Acyltransferase 3 domain-containing protein n=1 Tax=Paenibacillus eucommiae TaxID=1355755 RepID=A0ABS4IW20_9BACL|nr:acyltransferase family protein [Paenibacillus eucommiae]MBP1991770.1 hypothetical protein [Paenibacillus eucommiae]